jgi:predicted ATPase
MSLARGDRIGRYELIGLLGSGGMGQVWEAVLHGPQGFRKPVALKLLQGPPSEKRQRSLIREARVGALLSHPNVVATHELGEADGRWFVAMELVRGAPLSDLAGLSPAAALEAAIQACAGLAAVHACEAPVEGQSSAGGDGSTWAEEAAPRGAPALVHRDVKPSNLLVDRSGLVKVADLGIAGVAGVAGTPGFIAPEQLRGRPEPRSDLFALGVTLCELVTGEVPFGRTARPPAGEAPPELLARADAAAPGLGDVLRRCLALDPRDRHASAGDLSAALIAVRSRLPAQEPLLDHLRRARPDLEIAAPATTEVRGNLPAPRDRFVGREADKAGLLAALRSDRLVTLLGPGGMGKTRLSLEAARELAAELPGGAWFADLSEATTLDGLASIVAEALGAPVGQDAARAVTEALRGREPLLLVLDNFEQIVEHAAVVDRWRRANANATFLVTSRVALRLVGERTLPLGPLDTEAGVALFTARAARPPAASDPVAELVQRLDGMPLAIELAAARTRALPVPVVLERLRDRFRMLAGGGADLPERHRSLRASLDGSWELLSDVERAALAQLSVFAGGFSLEAAEAVLDLDGAWAVDVAGGLVDHSLVQVEGERFRLLVSVQEYAAERLADREGAERRHGAFYATLGSPVALVAIEKGIERFRATQRELDNLLAATRRALARRDVDRALPCARAAWKVLRRTGPYAPALELFEALVALERRPEAVRTLSGVLAAIGDVDGAIRLGRECVEAGGEPEDWLALGVAMQRAGQVREALPFHEEARRRARERGDVLVEASSLCNIAGVAALEGRVEEAMATYDESLRLHRSIGDLRGETVVLGNIGLERLERGRLDEGRVALHHALERSRAIAMSKSELYIRLNLGLLEVRAGRLADGIAHYEAVVRSATQHGDRAVASRAMGNLADALRFTASYADAIAWSDRAIAEAEALGHGRMVATLVAERAVILLDAADYPGALRCCEQWERSGDDFPPKLVQILVTRAAIALRTGQAGARPSLERAFEVVARHPGARVEGRLWVAWAELLRAEGDLEGAEAALDRALALFRSMSEGSYLALVLVNRAELAAARGRDGAAWLEEAERVAPVYPGSQLAQALARQAATPGASAPV